MYHSITPNFDTLESYLYHIEKTRATFRTKAKLKWIGSCPFRNYFSNFVPTPESEIKLLQTKEAAIEVVEQYFTKNITAKSVQNAMIQIVEGNYANVDVRIGIMLKKQPYSHYFSIQIRGIVGNYCESIEADGTHIELEADAFQFTIGKQYNTFPTKAQLISDICVFDKLEELDPISKIYTDSFTLNVYPTTLNLDFNLLKI
jgi:hypothetical protein